MKLKAESFSFYPSYTYTDLLQFVTHASGSESLLILFYGRTIQYYVANIPRVSCDRHLSLSVTQDPKMHRNSFKDL